MSSTSTAAVAALTICFMSAPYPVYGRDELPTPDVTLTSSMNPSNVGEFVTFTATVSSKSGPTPQGSVTISEYPPNSQPIIYGTVTLSNGVGVVTTGKLTVGTHVIWATYGGEPDVYKGAQSDISQVVNQVINNISTEPLQTVIPVHLDVSNGSITVGSTVYKGANPGMHLLAFSRQPDSKHLDAPDLIKDGTFRDASSANQFLTNILAADPDAFLIVNGTGNYGFALSAIAKNLEKFGAWPDIEGVNGAVPFVLLGSGGRNMRQALQRGFSALNLDGYLAADSNGNYTFIEPDYVQYDMTTDGTIKIGGTTYTVAGSNRQSTCDGSNAFHLVVVNREAPNVLITNNSYCTAQSDSEITRFWTDVERPLGNEGYLFFIASNGHPIPTNWDFNNCTNPPATCQGGDGDRRIQRLANDIARLGGYFETMVYLTPQDTYSLVGAPPPPAGTPAAGNRARESSSVYPDHPTGELHGVLARGRGNWYSPLDADPTGQANLGFYQILAQSPVPFPIPDPTNGGEIAAFQYINQKLCGSSSCNVRNQYPDTNVAISSYQTTLTGMQIDPYTNIACPDQNPTSSYCIVRQQLLNEFSYVLNIKAFNGNLNTLWLGSGTISILKLLESSNSIIATLNPPPQASAPNLVGPIVNLFLGVASYIPDFGALFGIADAAFNFATSLTTDKEGNQEISLTSTVAQAAQHAAEQFTAQGTTTGTQFDFIYQDWGKISALGRVLANAQQGSPWFWDTSATGRILQAMSPAIEESYYRSLMAAVYAIGRYVPGCNLCLTSPEHGNGWGWGDQPLWQQPQAYTVNDPDLNVSPFAAHKAEPFNYPWYPPYTFPTDSANPIELPSNPAYTEATPTLLAGSSWLAISLQTSPSDSGSNGLYNPPAASVLTHLFTPLSKGGLGVYRPVFFEGWPFPRVTCGWSDDGSGDPGPGCNWGAAAPSPDAVSGPVTSVSIGTGISKEKFVSKGQIQVPLTIINSGTQEIQSIEIDNVSLRALAGSGKAVLADPLLPSKLGSLAPGNVIYLNLVISVDPGVKKLAVTEAGTASSGDGAPLAQFSFGQVAFPDKEQ